ncbi:MAG: metal-sulfur cluster assembly factor [Haloferacaceae archaeon]
MSGVEPSSGVDAAATAEVAEAETETEAAADSADAESTPGAADVDEPVPAGQIPADATGLAVDVWSALEDVHDLHVPISLVDMGMIYGVDVADETGEVTVRMTFPCMGCPGYEMLQGDVSARVGSVPGVEDVTVDVVWDPIWTKDRLAEQAREELQGCGIGL